MDNQPVSSSQPSTQTTASTVTEQQKNVVLIVYVLQAVSFVVGLTSVAGVIINYLKRDEVKGTWLESHMRWQIKTFWYMLLGGFIGFLLVIVGIGFIILLVTVVWYIYRIIKGWLAYNEGKALSDGFL
ncbi:MAG: hypothetical protein M0Q49_00405 [Porticoccaceae bacterium]|nr:hypothetical protein [Porticoccaceae bacterium]